MSADYGMGLFPQHAEMLRASAVPSQLARARGYVSVDTKARLESFGYSPAQRLVPGLLVPLHAADGRCVGFQYRPDEPRIAANGRPVKYETPPGQANRLDVPPGVGPQLGDPGIDLWVTEGARKADAAAVLGIACVSLSGVWNWRTTNGSGGKVALPDWQDVALNGRRVVLAFDSDSRSNPSVGKALDALAGYLTSKGASVLVCSLPDGADGKTGLDDYIAAGHGRDDLEALVVDLPTTPAGERDGRRSAADVLHDLAVERYTFGCSVEGDAYALPRAGAPVARLLRGGRRSLRAELADDFSTSTGKAPSASALADVMLVLEGKAQRADPQPLHLRVAPHRNGLRLDLGRADGRAVDVTPAGWQVVEPDGGPLFRRTDLTSALPMPEAGGSLEELRALLNVTDRDWPLLVGWLVAAYDPRIPRPALLLTGEQGTGKTTTARYLVELLDPSPVPLRSAPRDEHGWAVSASASWVVGVDNLSTIPPWLSDAMCRAVTGDGVLTRRLYTDSDLAVLAFRRALLLTSIDLGALRGDLADRLLTVELQRIPPDRRRPDGELRQAFADAHPRLLGGLLDLLTQVLAALPEARRTLADRPRMADFAEVLAALDLVTGSSTTGAYLEVGKRLAADVVEGDPVAAAVLAYMADRDEWRGSAADMLLALDHSHDDDHRRPRDWPSTPRALAGRVLRAAPALRTVGVVVEQGKSHGARWYQLHKGAEGDGRGTVGGTVEAARGTVDAPYRPPSLCRSEPQSALRGTVGTVESPPPPTCLFRREEGTGASTASLEGRQEKGRNRPSAPSPPSPRPSEVGPCVTCGNYTRRYGPAGAPRCEPCQALHAPTLPSRRQLYADTAREAAS